MADRVIVYDGSPGRDCVAHTPVSLMEGMNKFLKNLEITCKSLLQFLRIHFAAETVPLDIVFQQRTNFDLNFLNFSFISNSPKRSHQFPASN